MDNLSHCLVGFAIAEAASNGKKPRHKIPLYLASALANNIPDLDILYGNLITSGKLGYLLHHRGYTHTLLACLPQSALILLLFFLYGRWRKIPWTPKEWKSLVLVSVLGPLVHIFMDWLNSYGVHPLWPWNNGWYYLDSIFIIEPFFWICIVPALFLATKDVKGKCFFATIIALSLYLVAKFAPIPILGFYLFTTVVVFGLSYWKRWLSSWLGLSLILVFSLSMVVCTQHIHQTIMDRMKNKNGNYTIALSPIPGNFLKRRVIIVSSEPQKNTYTIEQGSYDLWNARLKITNVLERKLSQLQDLYENHCIFSAYLRFARAPIWDRKITELHMRDMRFPPRGGPGFASIQAPIKPKKCPSNVPPWLPPIESIINN